MSEFPSLWSATANTVMPHPTYEGGERDVDVVVIGGGFSGLSTALHLAQAGVRTVVLEAHQPGWGASGRNGGQVIPGLKYDPDELSERYGPEQGQALIEMVGGAADTVFDLISQYDIDCAPQRTGWIQPAHSASALEVIHRRAAQWENRGAPIEILDRTQAHARLGTPNYAGAWVDKRAGSLHPLRYVQGLARAAQSHGVHIYGNTPAVALQADGDGWRITTHSGASIHAQKVVLGTGAYTDDLWPRLHRTVLPVYSFVLATPPLGDEAAHILPGQEVASDSKRLLLYFRRDSAGRFILGGRGPIRGPRAPKDWEHLMRSVALLYPSLQKAPIEYRWAGAVDVTIDSLPHLHELAPGVYSLMGYNGRGVAMATQLGKYLAAHIHGAKDIPLPFTPPAPAPMHRLRRLYLGLGVAYYGLLDRFS
jgi:glycine/D-amino acid oxidase-like deaminating enzyme